MSPPTTRRTSKRVLAIDRKEISYLQWMIEAYEGMASVRTIDPTKGEIEISIAPGCEEEILSLIKSLKEEGSIHVKAEKS